MTAWEQGSSRRPGDGTSATRETGDFEPQAPPGPEGPLAMSYHLYHDGQRIVEERNGSDLIIREYVPKGPQAVWGRDYVNELCQAGGPSGIGINDDPAHQTEGNGSQCLCDSFYYALHDPIHNVIRIVNSSGTLVDRYEYTPYGQRTVFISPGEPEALGIETRRQSACLSLRAQIVRQIATRTQAQSPSFATAMNQSTRRCTSSHVRLPPPHSWSSQFG